MGSFKKTDGDMPRHRVHNKHVSSIGCVSEVHISPEFPPIAGYTGHIPRVKGTEASLSQRYHTAAKRGLTLLRQVTHPHVYTEYVDKLHWTYIFTVYYFFSSASFGVFLFYL